MVYHDHIVLNQKNNYTSKDGDEVICAWCLGAVGKIKVGMGN